MKIYIEDIRRTGHCPSGIRRWFESYGFDFRTFLREGIDEEPLLKTGDAYAIRVVQLKHERVKNDGR